MKLPAVLALAALAFAGGYFARKSTEPERSSRADSTPQRDPEYRREVIANLTEEEMSRLLDSRLEEIRIQREQEEAAAQAKAEEEAAEASAEEILAGFKKAMRGQLPQWKSMMSVQAKSTGKKIGNKLDFTEEQIEKMGEAFDKEGERAAELAMKIMMGEFEGDEDDAMAAFSWFMGTAGTMSEELARELSESLSDEQIGSVREEMRVRNTAELKQQAEMQIRMMNIPNLNDTQKTELKEMFSDGGMMKEQGRVWTELMKDPTKLASAKTDEDWERLVAPAMEPNRRRMKAILRDDQYKAYEAYEKSALNNALIWIKPYLKQDK